MGTVYEEQPEDFERHAEGSAYNALYDRPAMLELLGDVDGQTVLDAGCGPGLYAEALLDRGATVIAFDASRGMVARARRRLGARATIREHDLAEPLTATCAEAADAGFLIERVIEPQPDPSMARSHPDTWAKLMAEPGFLMLRLLRA